MIAENSPDAIFIRVDEEIVYVNPAAVRILRAKSEGDLLGLSLLSLYHPANIALGNRAAQGSTDPIPLIRTRNGTYVMTAGSGADHTWNGRPAVLVTRRDITAQIETEERLREEMRKASPGPLGSGCCKPKRENDTMGKNIRSSSSPIATSFPMPPLADAMDAVRLSVDRFCLLAGVEAAEMMEEDATTVCGARSRHGNRRGYRWGHTQSEIGYHGGRVKVQRPRVRDHAGKEVGLESWQVLRDGNLLLEWALNLIVLNVSTRKYHRAVRLPEGDLAKARGDGTSKSAVSRRFVALSRKKMKAWLASDLSELDLLVIQIDGLHVGDHVLVAAIGVDGNGDKHVLAVVEGATENTVVVQALLDNLLARGLDPTLPRLFIVDGAKALSKAIRNTWRKDPPTPFRAYPRLACAVSTEPTS